MLKPVLFACSLICLFAAAAHAQEDEDDTPQDPCHQQVAATEDRISDKRDSGGMSEATTDKIDELLDVADGQCTQGDQAAAQATLKKVLALAK